MTPARAAGLLALAMAGISAAGAAMGTTGGGPLFWAVSAGLGSTLLALAWIDVREGRLPDALTLPLIAAGLAMAAIRGEPGEALNAALGAGIGYGGFVAVELGFRRLRGRDGLGRGDAKLASAGGAWIGASALPFMLLVASSAALAAVGVQHMRSGAGAQGLMTRRLPFGPWLALGVWVGWVFFATLP